MNNAPKRGTARINSRDADTSILPVLDVGGDGALDGVTVGGDAGEEVPIWPLSTKISNPLACNVL